jgi:hypothetical protein
MKVRESVDCESIASCRNWCILFLFVLFIKMFPFYEGSQMEIIIGPE